LHLEKAYTPRYAVCMSRALLKLEERAHAAPRARADRRRAIPAHLVTGERGEDAAFFHLRGLGYTIVARRWRSERQAGDLDLVAWDADTLVIFEVKARTARDLYPAEVQVDPHKQTILRKMAHAFLLQMPAPHRAAVSVRFDVLSVYLLESGVEFHHIPNAFPRFAAPPRGWR
jgi:putative endonuclease